MTLTELREERRKINKEIKERESNSFIVIKRTDVRHFAYYPQVEIKAAKAVEITEDSTVHQALNELYKQSE